MKRLAFLVLLATAPTAAAAQPAIAGWVHDPSGAPLPGVAVEAASPALIEQVRTAETDAGGRYRFEDLPPGIYAVTFSRQGWIRSKQGGIELSGSLTATVDAELTPGPFTLTTTINGETPIVDVHNPTRELTLRGEVVQSIPTARSYNALLAVVPGVVTNLSDTVIGTASTSFPIHGGRTNEARLMLDGLTIGSPPSGNSATSYVVDVSNAQETTFTSAGALGETETAGLVMNIVPRSGGNTIEGAFFAGGTTPALQWDNRTAELRQQGVASTPYTKLYDFSAAVGGPIVRNRLWYYVNAHVGANSKQSPNVYYNLNAGKGDRWLYAPDVNRPEYSDRTFENGSGRVTWQAARRHKIGAFWDAQALCRTCTGATPGLSEPQRITPEAVGVLGRRLNVTQVTWSSPLTNRLLLDAGFGGTFFGVGNFERVPNPTRDLIRVMEQCASGCAANGNIPGLVYRSQDFSVAHTGSYLWKGSLTYAAGTHILKAGYQQTFMTDDRTWMTNNQNLTYRVDNGVPNQLTESISPWVNDARAAWQGLYVQEQWTHDRVTLQGALRFDRSWSWFPAQQEGPSRFLPTPILIPRTDGVDSYKDVTARIGAAYDVSGTGKTALKVSLGKYLEGAGVNGAYANSNPSLRMPQTTPAFGTPGVTRAWTDANHDVVPDCDLLNPQPQDLRGSGGDLCGVVSNTSFGRNVLTNAFDPGILRGWGVRPSDWTLVASMQQQIRPRAWMGVTYTRRWFHGFSIVDNRALDPSDLTPFSIVAPLDPRLPGGGGYTVSGLYDAVPDRAGQVDNLVIDSSTFGSWSQYYNGVDVTFNVRTSNGMTLAGGTSTGQTVADNCDVRARLPELATTTIGTSPFGAGLNTSAVTPSSPYCHVASGIQTQVRGLSAYTVPKLDLQLAATFQSKPGPMLAANYAAPNSAIAPSLGRDLSGNAPNAVVNLIPPGTMYGDRVNQLDLRIAKAFKHARSRMVFAVEIYNALNSSAVLAASSMFVPNGPWLQPMAILTPRFVKLTADVTF